MRETGSLGKPHLVQAAEVGCLDLFTDLMEPEAQGGPQAHGRDLHDAVHTALQKGHTNIIHYLLETELMTPTSILGNRSGVITSPLGLAAMSGNRAMVDLLLSFGARLDSHTLILAIQQSTPQDTCTSNVKYTRPERPIYHMVKYLIASGVAVDRASLAACESRAMRIACSYRDGGQHKYKLTDGIRVTILVCHEARKRFSRNPGVLLGNAKMVLRLVLSGKLTVEDLFQDMAKNVMKWIGAAKPQVK